MHFALNGPQGLEVCVIADYVVVLEVDRRVNVHGRPALLGEPRTHWSHSLAAEYGR